MMPILSPRSPASTSAIYIQGQQWRRGLIVAVEDGKPRLIGPASARTPELMAALKEHREALIERYCPVPARRVVLLVGERDSEVECVLEQLPACAGIRQAREQAQLHPGRTVALEWFCTKLGWVRYSWISYPVKEIKHEAAVA
jgi:hypothetical protein